MRLTPHRMLIALTSALAFVPAAFAAPLTTLDRNGAWVSVEAYGPNVVHVTIAVDKDEVLKGPGYGILKKNADNGAFRHSAGNDGAKYFSGWLGVRAGGAAFTCTVIPFDVNVSPSLPATWRNAPLSACLARMP